jgi:hypothetical protein
MVQLKVVAMSVNRNSFGLRNVLMISDHGQGWAALANDLNCRSMDAILSVPDGQDIPTFLSLQSFEVPTQLPDPPVSVMEEVWQTTLQAS